MLTPRLDRVFVYTCGGKYSRKDIKRFIKYIRINKETGCWEWIGYLSPKRYGQFRINGVTILVHRAAIEMASGELIHDDKCVCHHCDNPRCVNVLICLFLGSHQDNMTDKVNKGRQKNGTTKLTWEIVKEIRRLWLTGKYTQLQLSNIYNITKATIGYIINNETWYDINYVFIKSINHSIKLSRDRVEDIRIKYATGNYTQKQLVKEYNISKSVISRIINNKTRK